MSLMLLNVLRNNQCISDEQHRLVVESSTLTVAHEHNTDDVATSMIPVLLDLQIFTSPQLVETISTIYGIPIFDLSCYKTDSHVVGLVAFDSLYDFRVLPIFARDNQLFLATSDPALRQDHKKIFFKTGYNYQYVLVDNSTLDDVLDEIRHQHVDIFSELEQDEIFNPTKVINDDGTNADGPVAKFVNKIIFDAVHSKASDIHFEFYEFFARIRFRLDGVLKEITRPPLTVKDKISSRIKVMSKMDIAEKRVPQDSSMKLKLGRNRVVNFRVSTLPTLHGEKIVVRILDGANNFLPLKQLGMSQREQNMLLEAIYRPYGMILVTGPTGSGKTVTLYNCLHILNSSDINISTVEDPVEINLPGANQVHVNDKQGLGFATVLRSFLRQDPDVIMVGEIRDLETADIALKASQTGHVVFATLHTNNAPASLTRLVNMGVQHFNVAHSVLLIIAQRLVRKLCPDCKKPVRNISKEELHKLQFTSKDTEERDWEIYGPVGCKVCKYTGYKGRIGIFEVMPISENIQKIILAKGNESDILEAALQEGLVSLRRSGLNKIKQGITSIDEIVLAAD